MTDRAQAFMNAVWEARKSGVETEHELVSTILSLAGQFIINYNAQNGMTVLDKDDLLRLAEELKDEK